MDRDWLKAQFRLNPDKTKAGLAKALGLEPPAISKILSGQRQIKAGEYVGMRRFFGYPEENPERGRAPASPHNYTLKPLPSGFGEKKTETGSDDAWVMPASVISKKTSSSPDQIRIFSIQENAMVPDFMPGEQVLVDLSRTSPSPAGVFVVSDGMSHIVRQCEYVPHSDPPEVRFSARNSKYEAYTLPLEKAQIIGRVIAKLEWL